MQTKLNEVQKRRLSILKPQFESAINDKDIHSAKIIIKDIEDVLKQNNNETLLAKYKNWFYELALDLEQYTIAENGFFSIRHSINSNTRIHLEATALLAICYLRQKKVDSAKPLIKEVLNNDAVIKTPRTRQIFNKNIIQRFDEEVALYSLKQDVIPKMDIDEIEAEAGYLIATKSEEELFGLLGYNLPATTKNILYEVDSFAKNLLPYEERKLLPSSQDIIKNEAAGKTVFQSFKRTIYNSICDQKSQVYKMWNERVVGAVFDTKYLIGAITLALNSINIGIKALVITAAALVVRFGLDIYCEHYKPKGVMEARNE